MPSNVPLHNDAPGTLRGFVAAIGNGIDEGYPLCCTLEYAVLNLCGRPPMQAWRESTHPPPPDLNPFWIRFVPCHWHRRTTPARWYRPGPDEYS